MKTTFGFTFDMSVSNISFLCCEYKFIPLDYCQKHVTGICHKTSTQQSVRNVRGKKCLISQLHAHRKKYEQTLSLWAQHVVCNPEM